MTTPVVCQSKRIIALLKNRVYLQDKGMKVHYFAILWSDMISPTQFSGTLVFGISIKYNIVHDGG
jgi:hypothetical protein